MQFKKKEDAEKCLAAASETSEVGVLIKRLLSSDFAHLF